MTLGYIVPSYYFLDILEDLPLDFHRTRLKFIKRLQYRVTSFIRSPDQPRFETNYVIWTDC